MNAVTPIGQYNSTAYFYPNSSITGIVGSILKLANSAILCQMNYSQIGISNITGWSFTVDVGSNPPLAISSAVTGDETTDSFLNFIISGGVEGQRYEVTVTIEASGNRTDTIIVNVPLNDCNCNPATINSGSSALYPTGLGQVYINSAPKYIVSQTIPLGANLMDQWYNPSTNTLSEYITDGTNYWWQTIEAATPPGPTVFTTVRMQPIPVDGSTLGFTLTAYSGTPVNILSTTDLMVSVDGVWQEPQAQFIAWSNQIQFNTAPSANSAVFMIWFQH